MMGWAPVCFRNDIRGMGMYQLEGFHSAIYFEVDGEHGLQFERAAEKFFDLSREEARMLFNPSYVDERRDYGFPMKYEEGASKSAVLKNFRWFIDYRTELLKEEGLK